MFIANLTLLQRKQLVVCCLELPGSVYGAFSICKMFIAQGPALQLCSNDVADGL